MGFESLRGAVIPDYFKERIKKELSIMMYSEGYAVVHVTPEGGVHSSGTPMEMPCISFEVQMGKIYYMISLIGYPKGIIFHVHVFLQHLGKEKKEHMETIYNKVKNVIFGSSKARHPAVVAKQISEVVPEEFKKEFEWFVNDFSYKAPEQHRECFGRLSHFCTTILEGEHPLKTDWKVKMISILTLKSEEDLRSGCNS